MPIFTAIATAIGGLVTAAAGALGTFFAGLGMSLLRLGLSLGLSLLSSALAGKPKKPGFSIQGKLQAGGDLPRSILLGTCSTAGSLTYANGWGKVGDASNAYLTYVIALCDMPVTGINKIWVGGEECTVLWDEPDDDGKGYPIEEYRDGGKDHLWINFYDGTQTAADPFMVSTVSRPEDGREYTEDMVGYGVAYAIMHALTHENLWSGFPSYKFELRGIALYDITKDTTAGGDGPQRWDDPETWGGDGDLLPACQIYNLLRGIYYNGTWLYGLQGMTAARLPAANWIEAINKCRMEVAGPEGEGVEPQYRAGGEIQVGAEIGTAIEALLTACAGRLTEVGGIYTLHVGAPDEPAFSITDADILSTEEQTFTPFYGLADTINGISAKYPSPADGWNISVLPPLYRPDLEATDGGRRLMADVSLDLVPYNWQAQRLMRSALEEARRFRRHTLTLPPKFWAKAVPNAYFEWNSARNGYVTKLFRIDGVVDKANCDIIVDCTEVDPADYDPDFDLYIPPVVVPTVPVRPEPQPIVDWYAEGTEIETEGGKRPAIILYWDNSNLQDIQFVYWEVKRAGHPDAELVHQGNTGNPSVGSAIITQGLIRSTDYEVRGRYGSVTGRPFLWSDWIDVRTPDTAVVNSPGDIVGDVIDRFMLSAAFRAALEETSQTIMRVRAEIQEAIDLAGQAQATLQGSTYNNFEIIKIANENAFVAIITEQDARITEDSAIYSSLNAVIATVEDPDTGLAAIGSIVEAQDIAITNNANGISALVTTTNAIDVRLTTAEGSIITNASAISAQTVRVDRLNVQITGTATAGASSSITLAVGSSNVNGYYIGLPITLTGGTGAGQTRYITAYNGSTRVATVNTNWTVNPASGTTYAIGNAVGDVALSSMINSVSTTVDGHTSSITTLASSYSGLAAKYGILFEIDGTTGGALLTGFTQLDGSVLYDALFSVDKFTIANLQNLVRNWIFDANGGTVNVTSKYNIARWAVTSGVAQVDVVANSDNGSLLTTPFCLKLALSSSFDVYSDEDPSQTNGANKGFAVQSGQKFKLRFQAVADASRNIAVALRCKESATGNVVTMQSTAVAITSGAGNYYEVEFTSNNNGRGYLRFNRSSTAGTVWITQVELMRMNGAMLIVDGTIIAQHIAAGSIETDHIVAGNVTTLKLNGQAVTAPIFDEIATGADDKTGTGLGASYANVHTHTETDIRIPNGETVLVFAMWTAVLEFTGTGGWDFRMDIGGHTDAARIYAPSGAAQQYFVCMTGAAEFTSSTDADQTLGIAINWKGESTVKVRRRNAFLCFVKR